jgi:hypothetical protein
MWEPRCLKTLWASTACYRNSFTLSFIIVKNVNQRFVILEKQMFQLDLWILFLFYWRPWVDRFTPQPLYFWGKSPPPCTHCVGGSLGPRGRLNPLEKINISCSCPSNFISVLFICYTNGSVVICWHTSKPDIYSVPPLQPSMIRAGFKEKRPGRLPRGLQITEI